MLQVSRDSNLKIPKKVENFNQNINTTEDKVAVKQAIATAKNEKSPKKYRGVFVNRMQNYCLDILEYLLEANFIRIDSSEKKTLREELQKKAIVKLKLLGYTSMLAENSGCILKKQYKQISLQLAEAINLIAAWKKSDDERWKKRI